MAMSSAPLHAARSNPRCHRSPAPAPPLVRHTTQSPWYISTRAAAGSAVVLLLRLGNLDSDATDGSVSHSSSDPYFLTPLVLCVAGHGRFFFVGHRDGNLRDLDHSF
ncbi:hypothetical protein ACQJBY_029006 [Aegilops geniculata]